MNAELSKYSVAIVPIMPDKQNLDPLGVGSGTCVRVGGRFFVATAAHVIHGRAFNQHFLQTPTTTNWSLRIVNGGLRGGAPRDELDVGWLELHGRAAAIAGRSFLDLARLRTYCKGDEPLVVSGSPQQNAERSTHADGSPILRSIGSWWATRGILDRRDLAEDLDPHRKMFLKWPRIVRGHNDDSYAYPEPKGISGGGVWATNIDQEPWRPEQIQLVGIEYAIERHAPDRYLKAFQMQVWLEMLRDDLPELASEIDPMLGAGRFHLAPGL